MNASHRWLLYLLIGAVWPVAATPATDLPANAHANRYSDGWKCDRGYREIDRVCEMIEIPANAFLSATG
jgi:hypothetical protein